MISNYHVYQIGTLKKRWMNQAKYQYRLDESSRKFHCPKCSKKRFVRFKDYKSGKYLPLNFGRCDREVNCGYFSDPYSNGYVEEMDSEWHLNSNLQVKPVSTDYIPYDLFSASLKGYKANSFIQYLRSLFDDKMVRHLINAYNIGSSRHWKGATVFWQIDNRGNIRTGKIMLYNASGNRVKKPYNHINWVHSLFYNNYNLEQCLFGEHLLTEDASKPVAIVESEKTAIISSVYFPQFIWLAAGAKSNLKADRCKCLIGRRVVLFPDLGAFKNWQHKAKDLSYFCDITVSSFLKSNADNEAKKKGFDLADYLIQYCLEDFFDEPT